MCRMIAKVSVAPSSIMDEMMMCPYSLKYLSENGRQPGDPDTRGEHNDGSGIAFAKNGNIEVHKRSKENAWDESYQQLIRSASSNIFIAHNRLASKGLEMKEQGAHPFTIIAAGKIFALCHNGGVRTYMEEAKLNHTSDSNIFLQRLIDKSGNNDVDSIYQRLSFITNETEYSSLCAYLMTAEELFVWRIYNERDKEKIYSFEKYYTLYLRMRNNNVIFASEPLDDLPWMLLENRSFYYLRLNSDQISTEYKKI